MNMPKGILIDNRATLVAIIARVIIASTVLLIINNWNILSAEEELLIYNIFFCHRAEGQIEIDGKLDEKAWRNAVPTWTFGDISTGEAPRYSAKAKILWDEKYLYLSYEIDDPHIWAECSTKDAIMFSKKGEYNESLAKVFIDPDGDGENYIEIHVNPLNNVMDAWLEYPWRKEARWKMGITDTARTHLHTEWDCPGLRTAVSINGSLNDPCDVDEGWTLEMAIPFSSLKRFAGKLSCPPKEGDTWRVHLARRCRPNDQAEETFYWTWPKAGEVNCHLPHTWGYLIFREQTWIQARTRKFKD